MDKFIRAVMHIPVGIFNVVCVWLNPTYGILFFLGFFIYELQQDYRLKDGAYLDIFGWLIGFALAVILLLVLSMLAITFPLWIT